MSVHIKGQGKGKGKGGGGGVGYCTDVLQISGGMSCCLIIIKIPGIAITSGP